MQWTWSDLFAILTIICGWIGFTFSGPGNVQNVTQAFFYVFTIDYFVMQYRRFRRKKSMIPGAEPQQTSPI